MDPGRFRRLIDLVGEALRHAGDDRATFLADACAGDDEMLREAQALLEGENDESLSALTDRLDAHLGRAAARTIAENTPASRAGARLGAYRLLREIGHGGMGTVWLAERADEQYRARVAIKVVRGLLATPELERRLKVERQILADLNHPGIARLLDGGAAEDGTPFLVMEYIEGEPIDAWCAAQGLGVRARIEIFLAACDAVSHAHRTGVVHRDIKPSNVLVGRDGQPKLVDFGIAKLVGEAADGDGRSSVTFRVMTPTYASPEQVRGDEMSAATDIYSLGVVLYELLAGRAPFDVRRASAAELERLVCRVRPPAPSEIAVDRDVAWRRALAGRLDAIVLRALEKEPDERHASVDVLASELRRHLSTPPHGRFAALGHRALTLARRPRALAIGGALMVVSGAAAAAHARFVAPPSPIGGFDLLPPSLAPSAFPSPYTLHAADVNGDGRADLIWHHAGGSFAVARVALANADGTLSFGSDVTPPAPSMVGDSYGLVVGDFTGDGLADLAWHLRSSAYEKLVHVVASRGDGSFDLLEPAGLSNWWYPQWEAHAADIDLDGRDDLVFNLLGGENVARVFRSTGDGKFAFVVGQVHLTTNWHRYGTHLGDIDGDGRTDIVWNDVPDGMNRTYVARSLDSLELLPWQDHPDAVAEYLPRAQSRWAGFVTHLGDIDGDGRADVLWIATGGDSVRIHRALGQQGARLRFLPEYTLPRPAGADTLATELGDFNRDGRADILLYEPGARRVWIALGTRRGTFVMQRESFTAAGGSGSDGQGPVVADFTGDGRDDLVWHTSTGAMLARARPPGSRNPR